MELRRRVAVTVTLVVLVAGGAASCSSSDSSSSNSSTTSSGNPFCDDYGKKIAALGCTQNGGADALAAICKAVLDGDKTCATAYQAVLTCQTKTSKCVDGSVSFGACEAETDAYGACKNGGSDAGGTEDTGGTEDAGDDPCVAATAKDTGVVCAKDGDALAECQSARATVCRPEVDAYLECYMAATSFSCTDTGDKQADGCDAELAALKACAVDAGGGA